MRIISDLLDEEEERKLRKEFGGLTDVGISVEGEYITVVFSVKHSYAQVEGVSNYLLIGHSIAHIERFLYSLLPIYNTDAGMEHKIRIDSHLPEGTVFMHPKAYAKLMQKRPDLMAILRENIEE